MVGLACSIYLFYKNAKSCKIYLRSLRHLNFWNMNFLINGRFIYFYFRCFWRQLQLAFNWFSLFYWPIKGKKASFKSTGRQNIMDFDCVIVIDAVDKYIECSGGVLHVDWSYSPTLFRCLDISLTCRNTYIALVLIASRVTAFRSIYSIFLTGRSSLFRFQHFYWVPY